MGARDWIERKDQVRRGCGYALVAELAKKSTKSAWGDDVYLSMVKKIDGSIDDEPVGIQLAMGHSLMNIGKRSRPLNKAALKVAKRVGPIPSTSKSISRVTI